MSPSVRRSCERGQGLTEFALVLPIFLLLIFGIVDAGRLVFTYNTIANAARGGARVAIVNQATAGTDTCDTTSPTAGPVGCAISLAASLGLTPGDVTVSYRDATDSTSCPTVAIGCVAVVTVQGQFKALTPIIGAIIGPVTLASTTKIPIERVCSSTC